MTALTPTALDRSFTYEGRDYGDPNPNATPDQVREMLAVTQAELTNAHVEGPVLKGNTRVYTFKKAVGTKG